MLRYSRICDFADISASIITIFARFLNSQICPSRSICALKTSRILPDVQYTILSQGLSDVH